VDEKNGGCFSTNELLMKRVEYATDIKHIIVQLSQVDRNAPHLTWDCLCTLCEETYWVPNQTLYVDILENKKTPQLKYFMDLYGHTKTDSDFLRKFTKYSEWVNRYVTELFIEKCKEWENTIAPVHFIDSWSIDDSRYWMKYPYIKDRMIELVRKDGVKTKKWERFVESFDYPYIVSMYPNTVNMHPSLELHQYIADSIITHIKQW